MRALYLFINGLASSNAERHRDRDRPWDEEADGGLTPIRPGAFARWMSARDASGEPASGGRAGLAGRAGHARPPRPMCP